MNGELPTECVNNLDIDNLIKKVSSNKFVLVSEFQGSGRWSYSNNIEHLLYWLGLKLLEKGLTVPNSLEGVELTFIYVDEECGCTHLAHEQYTIKLELDRDHLVQKKIEFITKRYDYNADNLMKLDVFDECYDLTQDTIPNLLLNATDDELEHLGLTGLVTEYTIKNVELIDLIDKSNGEILFYVTDIEEYLDIDTLRERLKVLKENEYQ